MKRLPCLFIASLLFITSCQKIKHNEELIFDKNSKQIVFFSNEKDYKQEASYYDAIIELKRDFPAEIKNMKIITAENAKKYYDVFDVQSCPAILLIYKDKVLVNINGNTSTEKIIKPLAEALKN
ncbi:small peptidoglycan-associated lipoprotein [Cytobacillus depressus]|uniref:Small peptidoglycan-associated lipoprotein n=1 Tax=Cytobacillus depressus TaxID=1602942 RepID=A0A6L3VCL1_9BACI|nr:small peptidoglycan-associated lipoprotein [Cytobacillus depressus]KAB2337350.1 small peptidoglycan-associated lipoprotein [Cytobacillus depressus]